MPDKEEEWIEKFRAAIGTAPRVRESRLKAMLKDLSSVGNIVNGIMRSCAERSKNLLSVSASDQSPRPEPVQATISAIEERQSFPLQIEQSDFG